MKQPVTVVYDKQCPVCHAYCELVRAADPHSTLLLDARADSELMREITRRKLDIDEGMVVEVDGALFYGADAIYELARTGNRQHWFTRTTALLFRYRWMARLSYPAFKAVRNLLLKLLGIRRINNLQQPGKDRF